jgi:hypothetical protein
MDLTRSTYPVPGLACDHEALRERAAELSPVRDGDSDL